MISIKELFTDSLNGLTLGDIPFLLVQLFSSCLVAIVIRYIAVKRFGHQPSEFSFYPVYALCITFIAIIAKNSVTIGLILVAVSVLFRKQPSNSQHSVVFMFILAASSIGMGSGHVVLTAVFFLLIMFLLLFMPGNKV